MGLKVGKIRDAHGMKGEVFLISFPKRLDWIEQLEKLTLVGRAPNSQGKHENQTLEFSILASKPHKNGLLLRLEGVTTRTHAEGLIGYVAELEDENLVSEAGEQIFLKEVEGFVVFNGETQVGTVTGFSSNGAQDLMLIDGGRFEVPLVPAFLKEIVWAEKQIRMVLPEGLLGDE